MKLILAILGCIHLVESTLIEVAFDKKQNN